MRSRPYVLLSVAASLDGYIDDTSGTRLVLSNDADLDRVDEARAGVDAILVGANTIRSDDPRLVVRSAERRRQRVRSGLSESPVKVTVTGTGELAPGARFFTTGDSVKLVYTTTSASPVLRERFDGVATVVAVGETCDVHALLDDLAHRGVDRLMVEGGAAMHTLFLTANVVDEVDLAYAPFFLGQAEAPRFVRPGVFPQSPANPMTLAETRQLGDVVFLRYLVRTAGGG